MEERNNTGGKFGIPHKNHQHKTIQTSTVSFLTLTLGKTTTNHPPNPQTKENPTHHKKIAHGKIQWAKFDE